jgi:hypothetical protein
MERSSRGVWWFFNHHHHQSRPHTLRAKLLWLWISIAGAINLIADLSSLLLPLRYPCAIGTSFHAHPPLARIAANRTGQEHIDRSRCPLAEIPSATHPRTRGPRSRSARCRSPRGPFPVRWSMFPVTLLPSRCNSIDEPIPAKLKTETVHVTARIRKTVTYTAKHMIVRFPNLTGENWSTKGNVNLNLDLASRH